MLTRVKSALQLSGNDFDAELTGYITAAVSDLNVSGVDDIEGTTTDELAIKAIITFCVYSFELFHGNLTKAEAIKKDYDSQKAILSHATGYTVW